MTETDVRPAETETGTGKPAVAHIVFEDETTDAYVFGTEITALCGYKWVPTRSATGLPVCPDCKGIALQQGRGLPDV